MTHKTQIDTIKLLCEIIDQRKLISFYYESKTSNKKEWRTVEPYIVGIKDKGAGNIFLAALPIEQLSKKIKERTLGHYLIEKLDVSRFKILEETFDEPNVERHKITHTPEIKVICRFIYADENKTDVKKQWIPLKDIFKRK